MHCRNSTLKVTAHAPVRGDEAFRQVVNARFEKRSLFLHGWLKTT